MPAYFGMLLKTGEGWSNIDRPPHGAEVTRQLALMNKLQGYFFSVVFLCFLNPGRAKIISRFLSKQRLKGGESRTKKTLIQKSRWQWNAKLYNHLFFKRGR